MIRIDITFFANVKPTKVVSGVIFSRGIIGSDGQDQLHVKVTADSRVVVGGFGMIQVESGITLSFPSLAFNS